jgi:very-short-patch-repair endonuclease
MRTNSNSLIKARQMRKAMSLPEVMLWRCLRGREAGKPVFRRQHPIGPYVLDFFCASARLCIEVDGGSHGFGDRPQRDARRDAWLRAQGIRTLRLAAAEVISDAHGVAQGLIGEARAGPTPPPPLRGPPPP